MYRIKKTLEGVAGRWRRKDHEENFFHVEIYMDIAGWNTDRTRMYGTGIYDSVVRTEC